MSNNNFVLDYPTDGVYYAGGNNDPYIKLPQSNIEVAYPLKGQQPPIIFERNQYGLLTHVNYLFTDNGFIDWRKMVPKEYLVPNKEKTKETDIDKLKEDELIILLGGIKYLAQLRGFTNVSYNIINANEEYAGVSCRITWSPNYETFSQPIQFEALAGVNFRNVRSFARFYLLEMAENRAFARCVRNFLKINIVSDRELGEDKESLDNLNDQSADGRQQIIQSLDKIMQNKKLTFADVKTKLVSEGYIKDDKVNTIEDIPTSVLTDLIVRLNKRKVKSKEGSDG